MTRRQGELFARALALHDDSRPDLLRQALAEYDKAASSASVTLPIAFNSASVCSALADADTDPPGRDAWLDMALSHLQNALRIAPSNVEAMLAMATVREQQARGASLAQRVELLVAAKEANEMAAQTAPRDAKARVCIAVRV